LKHFTSFLLAKAMKVGAVGS